MKILEQVSLAPYTTFNVEVSAKYLVHLTQRDDMLFLLNHPLWKTEKHLILGEGSNILFTNDFEGLIVVNRLQGKKIVYEDEYEVHIELASGESWHGFVMESAQQGWWGIENLAFIPGTVGAAPVQNIGAYGVEIESSIVSVSGIDCETVEPFDFNNTACQFGYRESIFKRFPEKYYISSVTIRLMKKGSPCLEYGNLRSFFSDYDLEKITPHDMVKAVIQLRRSKLPDVGSIGMAGSFFKNPVISQEHLKELQKKYPLLPFFTTESGKIKIPAGWLIEELGYKGVRLDNVGTYEKHALVLVNYGGATGAEVWVFAQKIINEVNKHFGILLEPEVLIHPHLSLL